MIVNIFYNGFWLLASQLQHPRYEPTPSFISLALQSVSNPDWQHLKSLGHLRVPAISSISVLRAGSMADCIYEMDFSSDNQHY